MARVLLSAMPFAGHVTPILAVARSLIVRGHTVRVYTGSAFEEAVRAAGACFVPWSSAPDFASDDLRHVPATRPWTQTGADAR